MATKHASKGTTAAKDAKKGAKKPGQGGSLHHYFDPAPLSTLTTNLAGTWFQLNVRHDINTDTVTVWFKSNQFWTEVWTGPQQGKSSGAKSYYMKDGVYS